MKILCIGEALIDMICTDNASSLANGEHFLKKPGGAPTNVAAAIAALGGEVLLAAKVGDDPFGNQLVNVMKDFGVSTVWMVRDRNYFTTIAFVSLMHDGERDFVFNRGADGQLSIEDIDGIDLDECFIIHFGSATAFLPGPLQAAYTSLLDKARNTNKIISFDPNYRQLLFSHDHQGFIQQSWNFLKQCHFFKVSDEEAMLLTHSSSINEAATIFANHTTATFAITLGKEGTMLVHRGQKTMVPSIAVKPVDTTGAGDAFVGAVLYQLSKLSLPVIEAMNTEDWRTIIYNGNKAGARTCEYHGAMEAFKNLSEGIFE
ncbi:carbohydrate kinase family protein [Segetibacter sp. 3557_3]|uniref:carbohydrate kinase family protein n=1 Tax=Segetibacter sp. 3557_3 TaxID=2547429 RepID=UPI001405600D|nr:carbohydrate kinase [Segetibacter sp. 3557_3]